VVDSSLEKAVKRLERLSNKNHQQDHLGGACCCLMLTTTAGYHTCAAKSNAVVALPKGTWEEKVLNDALIHCINEADPELWT
jgi:hypothetical protein